MVIKMNLKCPSCDSNIKLSSDLEVGEIVSCEECGEELEITERDGVKELQIAPDVEEDWGE